MARLRISPLAVADVTGISSYIAQTRPSASRRVGQALYRTFEFLARNPSVGTARDDVRPGLRLFVPKAPAERYVVFFQYNAASDVVEIAAVIDGARDWEQMF